MKTKLTLTLVACATLLSLIGCDPAASGADTKPLAQQDVQTKVATAEKNVDTSNMTPEQKEAAKQYLNQGADGAAKQKESLTKAGIDTSK